MSELFQKGKGEPIYPIHRFLNFISVFQTINAKADNDERCT